MSISSPNHSPDRAASGSRFGPRRLAEYATRRPGRVLAVWGAVVVVSLGLVGALLGSGLTSDSSLTNHPESAAAQIHLGDPVKVQVQALNQEIEGRVARFADSLDRQTRTMETEIDFDNRAGHLMAGMYTETRLSLREEKNALTVPLEAVNRNGDEASVLAVSSDNVVEERKVRLGVENSTHVEILAGLREEIDRIVAALL